jgi:hypothetical protein
MISEFGQLGAGPLGCFLSANVAEFLPCRKRLPAFAELVRLLLEFRPAMVTEFRLGHMHDVRHIFRADFHRRWPPRPILRKSQISLPHYLSHYP